MTKYFTQFDESTQTIGTNLAGWTTRGTAAPNGWAPAYGTPAVKKRYVNFKTNTSGVYLRNVITWDAIDADANRATVELLGCFSYDATTAAEVTLVARGVGASGAAATEGYLASCQLSGNIYIYKRSGVFTISTVATAAFTFAAGKSYFVRFQLSGSNLKMRVWDAALGRAGEPTTWNISTTDASFSSAGWVGLGAFDSLGDKIAPWNFLAVATNGDTAVCPRTNTEYTAWLDSQNAIRCVLAEMSATGYDSGGSPYTKTVNVYLSNHGYTSQQQDTPSLRHYDNYIQQIPTFTREMSAALSGQATTGFGDLIISNPASATVNTGVRDNWLRMRWNRNYLKLYLGDPSWPKHDFRLMIYGRLGMPSAPAPNQIKFPIADLSDALNAQLQTKFTSGDRSGQYKPKLYGAVFGGQIEPPETDSATLTHTIADAAVDTFPTGFAEQIAYLTDNGQFVGHSGTITAVNNATETLSDSGGHGLLADAAVFFSGGPAPLVNGTLYYVISAGLTTTDFRISATRGGAAVNITGATTGGTYVGHNYVLDKSAATVKPLAQYAGRVLTSWLQGSDPLIDKMYERILFTDLAYSLNNKDTASFSAYATVCSGANYKAGIWLNTDPHTGADVLPMLAKGTGSFYGLTPDGLWQVGLITLPTATAALSFTESDVVANSLRLVDVIRAVDFSAGVQSYSPWFVTRGQLGFNSESASYWTAAQGQQLKSTLTAYSYGAAGTPLDDHPDQWDSKETGNLDTLLISDTALNTLRTNFVSLFKQTLGIFEFTTRLSATQLNIGDTISLVHSRYEWKQYTGSDDASPDNTGTVEARYAVVIGIATDVARGTTKIKCFRRIPGYYPTTDLN